jgi:hypothetical protein
MAGDGRQFATLREFRLESRRWNYLTITAGAGRVSAYLGGRLVDSRVGPDPLIIKDSDLPVFLGD